MSWLLVSNTFQTEKSWFVRSGLLENFSKVQGISLVACECATVSTLLDNILEEQLGSETGWTRIQDILGEKEGENEQA